MTELNSFHEQDFYELLEINPDATQEEIDAAYERLKGVFDSSSSATYMLFGDDESSVMRQMLDDAYQTLSDANERERYDQKLGIDRTTRSAAQPARATSVTSTTTPIVTAAIVEDTDVVEATPPEPVAVTHTPPVVQEPPPPVHTHEVMSGPAPRDDENMEYSGGVLMRLRESKGVAIESIAQRTKISLGHLRAIESNQYDKLPARVYVRGFVAQYAKFLGLNAERVCASYLAIYDRFVQARTSP